MKIHYLWPALLLAGCATSHPPVATADLDSASLPQTQDDAEAANVRMPEEMKAYPVGRYQDQDDPSIMHEGHTVYRSESSPGWDTAPEAPTRLSMGPGEMATADSAQQHVALTAELEQRLRQEDQLLQATAEQNERLSLEIKKLQDRMPQLRPPAPSDEETSVAPAKADIAVSVVSRSRSWGGWIQTLWSLLPQSST